MKLYYLQDSSNPGVYYRMTKVYEAFYGAGEAQYFIIWTGVLDRAAFFLSRSAAQDVADDLIAISEYYEVVEYAPV